MAPAEPTDDPAYRSGLLALVGTFLTGVGGAAALGVATNAVNAAVHPLYFAVVMGWGGVDLRGAILAQGAFEGTLGGVALSLVFASGTALISRAEATYALCVRFLAVAFGVALTCWAIGGAAAVGLAAASPAWYVATFPPARFSDAPLRFAWVGGSIRGVIALVLFRAAWLRGRIGRGFPGVIAGD